METRYTETEVQIEVRGALYKIPYEEFLYSTALCQLYQVPPQLEKKERIKWLKKNIKLGIDQGLGDYPLKAEIALNSERYEPGRFVQLSSPKKKRLNIDIVCKDEILTMSLASMQMAMGDALEHIGIKDTSAFVDESTVIDLADIDIDGTDALELVTGLLALAVAVRAKSKEDENSEGA